MMGQVNADKTITLTRISELPEGYSWQKRALFPDWKGYVDDTLAINSGLSFLFWHGQGRLYLNVPDAVEGFSLYINDIKADTAGIGRGAWAVDFSRVARDGVNTLRVMNIRPAGCHVEVCVPYPEVLDGSFEESGIDPAALELCDRIIQADAARGFPGAQLCVMRHGRIVLKRAWGRVNAYAPDGTFQEDAPAVTNDTLYDLASVTKMFTTNYAIQRLVTEGKLDIDAPLTTYFGDAFFGDTLDLSADNPDLAPIASQRDWKRCLTLRHLICHEGGFPACPAYNDPNFDMATQAVGAPGSNKCFAETREDTLKAIFKTPLLYQPGTKTVYSDIDYMLGCFVIEAVTGKRLDVYMKETFFDPMGLKRITFQPLQSGFARGDCAATELNGNSRDGRVSFPGNRTGTVQGEVHDERAFYCMKGVSGHAGLFACATDLARLASVMLTGGYGRHRFFDRSVIDLFTAPKSTVMGQWGLGWWREGDDQRVWYFGTQSGSRVIGHQGWTGTLAMVDPDRDMVIVYLTNKINSPVTAGDNPNRFDGNWFTASSLGFITEILSIGLDTGADVSDQLAELTVDMAVESMKLVPDGAKSDHPAVRSAQAKMTLLDAAADRADPATCRATREMWDALYRKTSEIKE